MIFVLFLGRDGWVGGYLMLPPHEGKIRRCFGGLWRGGSSMPNRICSSAFRGMGSLDNAVNGFLQQI